MNGKGLVADNTIEADLVFLGLCVDALDTIHCVVLHFAFLSCSSQKKLWERGNKANKPKKAILRNKETTKCLFLWCFFRE